MTYNIKSGRHHPKGLDAVARVIQSLAPDVLAVQEVDEGMARTQARAQTDWLTRGLRMRGLFAPAMAYDGGLYGVALLSRWPIQAHERRPLFTPDYPDADTRPRHDSEPRVMLAATVACGGWTQPPPAARDMAIPREQVPILNIIVTHLGLTPDQRAIQAQELAQFARTWHSELPTIIMGDFNCDPDAPELAPLREHFRDACAVCGVQGDARYTFPSGPFGARTSNGWRGAIDYVWASPVINILSARVVMDETRASDHQPVIVEIEVDG
ncbi:MAG: endonuclease/exonuclease/phosphatase family protein [Chloroflexota bacterium]